VWIRRSPSKEDSLIGTSAEPKVSLYFSISSILMIEKPSSGLINMSFSVSIG
jgi:hypothetical protein